MTLTHLTPADDVTTQWSGGATTQLAIAPKGAVYADRDFLWRLSSATVELDESDFTPLPAYDRGQLQMGIPIYSYEELVQRIEDYIS